MKSKTERHENALRQISRKKRFSEASARGGRKISTFDTIRRVTSLRVVMQIRGQALCRESGE